MALKSRTWACPDCEGQFTTIADDREGPPKFCTLCGNDMSADIEAIPNFSRIGKASNQTIDQIYRRMESASVARAEQAASDMGVPVSEMSGIKMTDMKDNLREGDTSFVAPKQSISAPANINSVAGNQGAQMAAGIRKESGGSYGHKALDVLKGSHGSAHSMRAKQMSKAGQIGAYSGR